MDPSMDLSIDHQVETTNLTLHIILDQITETTATPVTTICTTDKATTEIATETKATSTTRDTNKEIKTTKTGMIKTKIEIGLTIEEDQTNTNTTQFNTRHKSSSNSRIRT